MTTYLFFREDTFYPLGLKDDTEAIENALCNPGTTKVAEPIKGGLRVVWTPEKQ